MARTKIDYGIDLGTTNSAIARMENGSPKIIKSDTLKDTIPSCVFFNKKKTATIGDAAFNNHKRDKLLSLKTSVNSNAFIEFKRTMGTDKKYRSSNMGKDYTSEDLSSEVLKKLKSFVSDENLSSAIITVPAKFNTSQIDATQKAAELAGFDYVELLQEPIAASMAYGIDGEKGDGFWLVFDFGGGTFDAALVKVDEGIMQVIDTEGDNHLGGKDLDNAIVDKIIIPYLEKEYSIKDILSTDEKTKIFKAAMKGYAEDIKIQLSFNDSFDVLSDVGDIPGTDDDGNELELDLTVSSSELKDAISPIFQQATDVCKELLKRNNLKGNDLSTILLVGGPTYSPILRKMLKDQISPNVDTSIDPMTAVASGAALFASTKDIPTKHQKRDKTKVQLDLNYEATSVEEEEYITVKVLRENTTGEIPDTLFVELVRTDKGWSSGKVEIAGDAELIEASLEPGKSNGFDVLVYDDKGSSFECEPSNISIIQGSKIGNATLPQNIGIEIKDSVSGLVRFKSIPGLEKNASLPAIGKTPPLKTQSQIRPGEKEDIIKIPMYEGEYGSDGTRAINNDLIKQLKITGEDLPKLLPEGSDVELTVKVDSSRRVSVEVFIPYLDETIELEIGREINTAIEAEILDQEILKGKNQLIAINEQSDSVNVQTFDEIEKELGEVQSQLDSGRDDEDNRNKVLDKLRKVLKQIDKLESDAEWPRILEELEDALKRLEELNEQYGNEKTIDASNQLKKQAETVIKNKDSKIGEMLSGQIRGLNFALVDEGAGVALEIAIIKNYDDEFDMQSWSDKNQARSFINQAKQIISTNPTKQALKPIVHKLWDLLPDVEKKGGLSDDDSNVLTN
jgi:molecular chaperone DnaK